MFYFVIIKFDNLELNPSRNFEIVASYFYPKTYMTYGELGRIREKYPKLHVVELNQLLESFVLSLCSLLCLSEVAKRNRGR